MTTPSACISLDGLKSIETSVIKKIYEKNSEIEFIETKKYECKTDAEKQILENKKNLINDELTAYVISMEKRISYTACTCLQNMEKLKINGVIGQEHLERVGNVYMLISRWGKFNLMYKRIPPQSLCTGIYAGILEDLLYVLRHPTNIGLKAKHIQAESEIVDMLNVFFTKDKESNHPIRLSFLNYLFKTQTYNENLQMINSAVNSQFLVNKIGLKQIKDTNEIVYFAHSGLYDRIPYDARLVTTINNKYLSDDQSIKYAIHFMRKEFASMVWNTEETLVMKSLHRKSSLGSICVVEKSIIATPMSKIDKNFKIHTTCKKMKKKINHGLDQKSTVNYTGGLIIDLKELCDEFSSQYPNGIQLNGSGLILIHYDVPESCIVGYLEGEELEKIWDD